MPTAFIMTILRLPAEQVLRFQTMAAEECARAAVPQVRRTPLPYIRESVLRMLTSEVEVDIVARLVDDLGLLLDAAAARSYKEFVANDRTVKSSAALRVHCLKRAPAIEIACYEDKDTSETAAVAAVQALWRLLVKSGMVVDAERADRTWYRFGKGAMQPSYDFEEVRSKAIENWRALRKPAPTSRTRLIKRR